MTGRASVNRTPPLCPVCGQASVADGGTCSPLRCSAWKVIGKTTKPDALGMKRMLIVVEGGRDE